MRILAIDPALNKSGWAVIKKQSDGSLIYIDSGIIKVEGSLDLMLKLKIIKDSITEIIKKFRPEEIAIEEIFVNKNPSTSLKLGHARGVIIAACLDFEIEIYQYAANLIKKSICGMGRADKQQVATMVKILMPKAEFKYDDESDALALAICHVNHRQFADNFKQA